MKKEKGKIESISIKISRDRDINRVISEEERDRRVQKIRQSLTYLKKLEDELLNEIDEIDRKRETVNLEEFMNK